MSENWYASSTSGGQALVICEDTGRNVAVVYYESDARLISEAPAMLDALREIRGLATWHSTKAKGEIYARASAIIARIDSAD